MTNVLGCLATTAAVKYASDARENLMMDHSHSRALVRDSAKRAHRLYTVVPHGDERPRCEPQSAKG